MHEQIKSMLSGFNFSPGASLELLRQAQTTLGISLPEDYVQFMLFSNGAGGHIGSRDLIIYPLEEVLADREDSVRYGVPTKLVIFGSDGGTWGYAFDSRTDPVSIVGVDPISMEFINEPEILGTTFLEFLESLRKRG